MAIRNAKATKKWMTCLRCGRRMDTDIYHRLCRRCKIRNSEVRHRVGRGETAYSIARLYGVSVRSLAEWNGLGPELAVREGQYLIIPIIIEEATATGGPGPGMTVAPLPPSADEPLPEPVEPAPAPPQGTEAAAPAAVNA